MCLKKLQTTPESKEFYGIVQCLQFNWIGKESNVTSLNLVPEMPSSVGRPGSKMSCRETNQWMQKASEESSNVFWRLSRWLMGYSFEISTWETAYMELTRFSVTIISCLQLWFHGTLYLHQKMTFRVVAPGDGTASGDGARELTASTPMQNSKSLPLQLRLSTSQHSHSGSSWRHASVFTSFPPFLSPFSQYFIHISIIQSFPLVNSSWSSLKSYICAEIHRKQRPLWISMNREVLPPESTSLIHHSNQTILLKCSEMQGNQYFVQIIINYIISHCYIISSFTFDFVCCIS